MDRRHHSRRSRQWLDDGSSATARIAAIGPARVEWYLARRPNRREALALALELLVFAPDADEGIVDDVAAALRVDRTFTAWWD